jgi:cobalt-zinc-cadmium efflux system outer membrane protein
MFSRLPCARAAVALLAAGCAVAPTLAQPASAVAMPPRPATSAPVLAPAPAPVPAPAQARPAGALQAQPAAGASRREPADAPAIDLPAAAASGVAATAALSGGVRIGLDELTDAVLRGNPGLLSAERQRNTAIAAIVSAGALPNPRLDFGRGDQRPRTPGSLAGPVHAFGVAQLIENPALRRSRLNAALSGERVSAHQASMTRSELVAQVRLRAWDLLLRQAEAAAAAETAALLEQVNSRVRARVDSGEAPRYELIKAEAESINARSLQQTALLQAQQTGLSIDRLAAGTLPARWSLDAALDDSAAAPDLEQLRLQMLERNPELLALRAEVERADAQLAFARAGRWPGVELRLSHSRDPEVRQNALGVSVQVPLFDRRTGPIAEAGSELERARGYAEGRRAELEQQLLQAGRALEMARLRTEALSRGAIRDAEAALRVADAAWRFGERGILDVLDAQRVLRAVRADLLTARFQVQAARTELDFLSGRWAGPLAFAASPAPAAAGLQ